MPLCARRRVKCSEMLMMTWPRAHTEVRTQRTQTATARTSGCSFTERLAMADVDSTPAAVASLAAAESTSIEAMGGKNC